MKLDISMALPSLHKQPLNLQGMGGSAFIGLPKNMLCVQRRQSQQGDKVCKRSHILCSKERASEIVLASSQQAYNIQKIDVFELPTLQQPVQVEEMRSDPILKNETEVLLSHYIPVFVMLPLDVISNDNTLQNKDLLKENLKALKSANVDGLMVDVWWGIVEAEGPKQYDWSAYRDLFKLLQEQGFKLQAIMSFHQCGGNTGDDITIPLPKWVLETAESNPNLFFTNKDGQCNKECLTYGVDDKPVLLGRTAVEIYSHYMKSFRENMSDFLDSRFITDIEVGLGPAGELRYPSYSKSQGWKFPGIGEFQCYDEYLLSDLKAAALSIGRPEWAFSTPDNAGNYNDEPNSTDFFRDHGSYTTESGKFFLTWYSNMLLRHGDKILEAASKIFEGCSTKLAAKVAGIHWWYKSSSHAAELTAGYYNLDERDGYRPIARMLARHRAVLNFTCIEMQDEEHPSEASCGPEALVKQVLNAGWKEGIEVSCENALPRYDRDGYEQMIRQARPDGINRGGRPLRRICALTYLRLSNMLMQENPCKEFKRFVQGLHVGLDYHPEPEKYFNPRGPLQRSKPRQETREFLDEAVPLEPFSDGAYASFNLDAFRTDKEESEKDEGSFIDWILRRLLSWYQDKN